MRKKYLVAAAIALSFSGFAQTPLNVDLFNQRQLHGTPRFTAMGGAFTSLGNDLSSLSLNPAGIGVYRKNQTGLSLGFHPERAQLGPFYGNSRQSQDFSFLIENAGVGFKFAEEDQANDFGIGLTYNRLGNFDQDHQIQGFDNPRSLGQFWGESSANLHIDILQEESKEAYAAWDAFLLVSDSNRVRDTAGSYAFGRLDDQGNVQSNTDVRYTSNQSGSFSEMGISFGGDIERKLYYGLSLNFPTLSYRREEFITETPIQRDDPPYNATEYTYRRLDDMQATGFNMKVGLIYRPTPEFRLGASYESPSWYTVRQLYEFDVSASFDSPPIQGVSSSFNQSETFTEDYSYGLRTPSIWRLGASGVIAKRAIVSLDYTYSNAQQNNLYTNSRSRNISEADLQSSYQPQLNRLFSDVQQTIAAGVEYRIKALSLRGGYRWQESPYSEQFRDFTLSNIETISGGLGYRIGAFTIDVTYLNMQYTRTHDVYTGYDVKTGNNVQVLEDVTANVTRHSVMTGFTYIF